MLIPEAKGLMVPHGQDSLYIKDSTLSEESEPLVSLLWWLYLAKLLFRVHL